MNSGLVVSAWILAALCVWIPTPGSALKCHVCNSVYNDSCVVIDTNQYLTDCMKINHDTKRNYTICRKESFSVSSTEFQMTTSRTIRTCGYEKHPKFDCFYNSNHDIKETICECTEDGCNTGSNLQFMLHNLVFGILSTYLLSNTIK
ncbi:hypothetical protein JTE90_021336 [Oedothorax gibbosus]|uniref:Protein sleepless n=1 Tax=Oedothorax gibbosus TaxID=931172 RepID=A0AAV6TET3_9ARAC|nr:hypothetical protein JTE90_021336 [Oedothorax gibbosus]